MNSKHTPGPWTINWYICREGKKELWRVPHSIGPVSTDHNHWAGNHLDVEAADAALISAAPDLLAALQELRYACTNKAEAMADAAIAKATGAQSTPQPADLRADLPHP